MRSHRNTTTSTLHRDDRASLSILMLLTMFVWVALIGMVWNVGEYSYRKQLAQDAADSAAYGTAQWMSRGMNTVTATNMAMVRNASAMAIAEAHVLAMIAVAAKLIEIEPEIDFEPWNWAQYVYEWIHWGVMVSELYDVVPQALRRLPGRQSGLEKFQQGIVEAVPEAIENQRFWQQIFSYHRIALVQPGRAEEEKGFFDWGDDDEHDVELPLKQVQSRFPMQFSWVTHRRVARDRKQWDDDYAEFELGDGKVWWSRSLFVATQAAIFWPRRDHYVLPTSGGFLNFFEVDWDSTLSDEPFTKEQRLEHFTVVATATPASLFGFGDPHLVLTSYFRKPANPVAFAQAETFNGMNASLWLKLKYFVAPWRVWTKPGWNWRPRLATSDGIEEAMTNHPRVRRTLLGYFSSEPESETADEPIALH